MIISFIYFFIPFFNKHKYLNIFKYNICSNNTNNDASMIPKSHLPRRKLIFKPIHNKPI